MAGIIGSSLDLLGRVESHPYRGRTGMMRRVLMPVVAGMAVVFVGEGVHAADYPEPPSFMPVQEFVSNWYVRVDGGYGVQSVSGGSNTFTNVRLANAP